MERTVTVDLGPCSYEVRIAPGLLGELGAAAARLGNVTATVVVSDRTVAKLYARGAIESLSSAGLAATLIDFPAGEQHKTLATYESLCDRLLALKPAIDRDALVVALGGGVTGDLAGFVAATLLRGLRLLQCPTSLLACVDSSVGGKTGVDHAAGKNLIGAFHQPVSVLIDVETLETLPALELRNGLAECVKHGVIRDATLLEFIEENIEAIFARQPQVMCELVARNVAIKADVVSRDEREAGVRAHLNFGHTIGHAIEALVGYDRIRHGQAVALGMVAACHIATARGLIGADQARRVWALLERLGLRVRCAPLAVDEIRRIMQHDKKTRAGRVRMVLPGALGTVDVYDDITAAEVTAGVEALAE